MKSRKDIYKALQEFEKQEKFKSHEGLSVGLLWIHEFLDYLFNFRKEEDEK